MQTGVPPEVLQAFIPADANPPSTAGEKIHLQKIGHGLINDSWKVTSERLPDFFLQRINPQVFTDPEAIQQNYIRLWEFTALESTGQLLPAPLFDSQGNSLFRDGKGDYWRAFEWIADSMVLNRADTPDRARATARAFARLTASFENMNMTRLKEVIPGFHDLSRRYRQFEEALQTDRFERMAKARSLISEMQQRERYNFFYEEVTGPAGFPKRVMHHDAKISNILFHEKTGKVICPVDLDTVMPGYFFSDLGDMIRSMVCSEDENHLGTPQVRHAFYEAIVGGYLDVLGGSLDFSERKYIHAAGLLMIYMQTLRFLTDYLLGDMYYKTEHPDQNFERAENQLALLKSLEHFLATGYDFRI